MMTSSVFYIEPSHVHLTSSTSMGFIDHYSSMVQINKLHYCSTNISRHSHDHFLPHRFQLIIYKWSVSCLKRRWIKHTTLFLEVRFENDIHVKHTLSRTTVLKHTALRSTQLFPQPMTIVICVTSRCWLGGKAQSRAQSEEDVAVWLCPVIVQGLVEWGGREVSGFLKQHRHETVVFILNQYKNYCSLYCRNTGWIYM